MNTKTYDTFEQVHFRQSDLEQVGHMGRGRGG